MKKIRVKHLGSKIFVFLSMLAVNAVVLAKFRETLPEVWYSNAQEQNFPIWSNYTEMNRTHESIKIAWEPV